MPHQCRPSQNWPWGPKLPHVQNLRGDFVVFFLRGQNCNFEKVRRLKLLLSKIKHKSQRTPNWKIKHPQNPPYISTANMNPGLGS